MKAQADDFPAESSDPVEIAAQLIARLEGFSPTAYPDPANQSIKYSIGYGHQIRSGDGLDTTSQISQSDAQALLEQDLASAAACVNNAVTVQLAPNQLAALYSFTYNVGSGNFLTSTLLKLLNAGDLSGAQQQFAAWRFANGEVNDGLVHRRQEEAGLFGSGGPQGPDETADA
jgi:lysozyme